MPSEAQFKILTCICFVPPSCALAQTIDDAQRNERVLLSCIHAQLLCPLCECTYTLATRAPKLLACAHTVCAQCLLRDAEQTTVLRSSDEPDGLTDASSSFRTPRVCCPICHTPVVVDSASSAEAVIGELPDNEYVSGLMRQLPLAESATCSFSDPCGSSPRADTTAEPSPRNMFIAPSSLPPLPVNLAAAFVCEHASPSPNTATVAVAAAVSSSCVECKPAFALRGTHACRQCSAILCRWHAPLHELENAAENHGTVPLEVLRHVGHMGGQL